MIKMIECLDNIILNNNNMAMFLRLTNRSLKGVRKNTTQTIESFVKNIDGKKTFDEKINILTHISTMCKKNKYMLGTYGVMASMYYIGSTYSDGKKALIHYRRMNSRTDEDEEWLIVKKKCMKNSGNNLFCSIIFPYMCFNSIIPYIILFMNEKK